jgi:hypothetical protein
MKLTALAVSVALSLAGQVVITTEHAGGLP